MKFIKLLDAEEGEPNTFQILNVSEKDLKWHKDTIKFLFLKGKQVSFSKALLILENDLTFAKNQAKIPYIIRNSLFFKIRRVLKIILLCVVFAKIRLMCSILKHRLLLLGGRMDIKVRKSTSDLNCLP